MKKFILGLLLSVPALSYCAGTTTVGGFEFAKNDVKNLTGGSVVLTRESSDGTRWYGNYNGEMFFLAAKAAGKNKAWFMVSPKNGGTFPMADGRIAKSLMFLEEIDCSESKYRFLASRAYANYFGEGKRIADENTPSGWAYEFENDPRVFFGCLVLKMP